MIVSILTDDKSYLLSFKAFSISETEPFRMILHINASQTQTKSHKKKKVLFHISKTPFAKVAFPVSRVVIFSPRMNVKIRKSTNAPCSPPTSECTFPSMPPYASCCGGRNVITASSLSPADLFLQPLSPTMLLVQSVKHICSFVVVYDVCGIGEA